jgi:hypothetical protein
MVDLDAPDLTVRIEVREDEVFLFVEKLPGPGDDSDVEIRRHRFLSEATATL